MPNFRLYKPPSVNYVGMPASCVANLPAFDTKEKSIALAFLALPPFWKVSLHWPAPKICTAMKAFCLQEHLSNTMQDNRRTPA